MICKIFFDSSEYYYPFYDGKEREQLADFLDSKGILFNREWKISQDKDGKEVQTDDNKEFFRTEHSMDIIELAKANIKFRVVGTDNQASSNALVQIANLLSKFKLEQPATTTQNLTLNLPGSEDSWLHKVDEVEVITDACTDYLRDHINEKWRIIAVCQQKNARRPDYVLGRIKEPSNRKLVASNGSEHELPF